MAVFPSADNATERPCNAPPAAPVPTSLSPCWFHTLPERVYTQAAPAVVLSVGPPTMAVFPSADRATDIPCSALLTAPVPKSLPPCWFHTLPERVYTQAAPAVVLSVGPPTMAVFPSADRATDIPCSALLTAPVPKSLPPCWFHTLPERVYTQAAPAVVLSVGPPTMAVFPSADRATDIPCSALLTAPVPKSLPPCWFHTLPERVYTQAAPAVVLSVGPPTMAVFPSADRATDIPCSALLTAPVPKSLPPCWFHTLPERVYTQAAPAVVLSVGPPTMAVFPSADRATDIPCSALLTAPVPKSLPPCWFHTLPERVYTQAAPAVVLSVGPPTMAVFPSADRATDIPCSALLTAPVPKSLPPCWFHTLPERVYTQAAPAVVLSVGPPTMAVFPSADRATDIPCSALLTAPVPKSLPPCWFHTPPVRVSTQAAPALLLSPGPPTMAVFPSADNATERPCPAPPAATVPTSLSPCWFHTPPVRVYTQAAPAGLGVSGARPPAMPVSPARTPPSPREQPGCTRGIGVVGGGPAHDGRIPVGG